jgi:hypothetical protein
MKHRVYTYIGILLIAVAALSIKASDVDSALIITAPDGFSVSCATNYTRVSPHLCFAKLLFPEQWTENTTGCKTHTLTTVSSTATLLIMRVQPVGTSSNIVNNKSITTLFYQTNVCISSATGFAQAFGREFVAVVAGTTIIAQPQITFVTPFSGNVYSNTTFTNTGAGSSVTFDIMGYYD